MIVFSILGWIVFSIIAGAIGSNRKIGFAGSFFLSLLLSPLIGLIITLFSKSNSDIAFQSELLETQKSQKQIIDKLIVQRESVSITDELIKAKGLFDSGILNQEEFDKIKKRIMDSPELISDSNAKDTLLNDTERENLLTVVNRISERINEAIQTNLKNSDYLQAAVISLSLNSNHEKIITLYKEKNGSDLFDDIKSIKTTNDKINKIFIVVR